MNVILLFFTAIVVWLNRGLYDPSVPVLTALFLFWVGSVLTGKGEFKKLQSYLKWIPWIWAILFAIRTDILYVSPELVSARRVIGFFPFFGLALYHSDLKSKWMSYLFFVLPFIATLYLSPSPHIDVFQSNKLAVDYFLHGVNPYAAVYPDIYRNEFDYHPGFLYWPGALLFQTISEFLFHDVRAILIIAWVGGAYLLRKSKEFTALWLCLPFLAFAFEQAWLDPLIALGGVLTLVGLKEKKHFLWIAGVVIAATVKQYGFMIGLFSVLYFVLENGIPKARKPIYLMIAFFGLVMIPFIAWGPHEFLQMTVLTHASAKIRPDALNFTAFWLKMTGQELSGMAQLIAILAGLGLALLHVVKNRISRGLKVIPESWAIFFGFSIYFGKFAFCNYHLLFLSFLLLAISVSDTQMGYAASKRM